MSASLSALFDMLEAAVPDLAAMYAFGSVADGNLRPDSDIDLAILPRRALDPAHLAAARETLALAASRDVDLVDLSRASTILQMEVLRANGPARYRDPLAAGLFETRVMRDYQDLKEKRAALEADIGARGAVYGR